MGECAPSLQERCSGGNCSKQHAPSWQPAMASSYHLWMNGSRRVLSGSGPLYVASTGSDSNSGDSPAAPKRTIAAAIAAAAGRHIHIAGGTYAVTTLNLLSNTLLWGGWSSDFSSRSPDSFPTFINADNVGFQCTSRSNILLEGLRVTVSRSSGHTVYGVKLRSCSNVRVHNTRIVVAEGGDGSNGSPGTDGANGGKLEAMCGDVRVLTVSAMLCAASQVMGLWVQLDAGTGAVARASHAHRAVLGRGVQVGAGAVGRATGGEVATQDL